MRILRPAHRRKLKWAYFQLLATARVDRFLQRVRSRGDLLLILNFHRVSPIDNPYWAPLAPEAFDQLVAYLASSCQLTTFHRLAEVVSNDKPRVILSFDDGCRDFVEYAMPILHKYGVHANHNLIAQSVVDGRPPWIIRVVDALNAAPVSRVQELSIPGFDAQLLGDDFGSKTLFGTQLTAHLRMLTAAQRDSVCESVEALIDDTDPALFTRMMSRSDVQEAASPHEFGAHSYRHETLSLLDDSAYIEDVDRCCRFFDDIGQPMRIFAFPYGSFRPDQIGPLRERGVEYVLGVGERPSRIGADVHTRITMYGDSVAELRLRALGHRPVRPTSGGG